MAPFGSACASIHIDPTFADTFHKRNQHANGVHVKRAWCFAPGACEYARGPDTLFAHVWNYYITPLPTKPGLTAHSIVSAAGFSNSFELENANVLNVYMCVDIAPLSLSLAVSLCRSRRWLTRPLSTRRRTHRLLAAVRGRRVFASSAYACSATLSPQ